MTEPDWLSSGDPAAMLRFLNTPQSIDGRPWSEWFPSDRKLRLFAVALYRVIYAETTSDIDRMTDYYERPESVVTSNWLRDLMGMVDDIPRAKKAAPALLRDIFGNPFTPTPMENGDDGYFYGPMVRTATNTQWTRLFPLTHAVLSIAQTIYDERSFDRIPVLADALEEAGCREAELLRHLRGEERCWCCRASFPAGSADLCSVCCHGQETLGRATGWAPLRGPHVRGCWALDLILGKE